MSTSLMIFIGENVKFDFSSTVKAISSIDNIYNLELKEQYLMQDVSIGSILFCEYRYDSDSTIIHLSNSLDFISADNLSKASLDFALKLQSLIEQPLTATDTDYSFQVKLKNITSVEEFEKLMCSGVYIE